MMAQWGAYFQQISQRLAQTEQQLALLQQTIQRQAQFPEQFAAGVIRYPDRYPFPMVFNQELLVADGTAYGITNAIARTLINVDVDNPTFLSHISFSLQKTTDAGGLAITGAWMPLSCTRQPIIDTALANFYIGRDFRWRIQTSSDDRLWQTGWHSSDMCDGDDRQGYRLPITYELRRNDVLTIEAQPIGAVVANDVWQLFVNLHVYKMLLKK